MSHLYKYTMPRRVAHTFVVTSVSRFINNVHIIIANVGSVILNSAN